MFSQAALQSLYHSSIQYWLLHTSTPDRYSISQWMYSPSFNPCSACIFCAAACHSPRFSQLVFFKRRIKKKKKKNEKKRKKAGEKSEELREDREKKLINIRNNDFLKWQKSLAVIFFTRAPKSYCFNGDRVFTLTVTWVFPQVGRGSSFAPPMNLWWYLRSILMVDSVTIKSQRNCYFSHERVV